MKKKLCLLLLIVLIVPIFALFGCDEVTYYDFSFTKSSEMSGSIAGSGISSTTGKGTFAEGSQISITATANQYFLGWVFQGTTLLSNGEDYSITNTFDENEKVKTSTLSFRANNYTTGTYTAVFYDNTVMYAKFDGFRISKDNEWSEGENEIGSSELLFESINQINISQGTTNFTSVYMQNNLAVYDNVNIRPDEEVTEVIRLSGKGDESQQPKQVSVALRIDANRLFPFTSNLYYKNSEGNVRYENGIYTIRFSFEMNEQTYYLFVVYKTLA